MRLLLLNKCLIAGGMAIGLTLGVPMIASAAKVYIPTGDENRVLVVDSSTDRVVDEISGVDNSHGLAGNQITRTLLAGSLNVRAPGEVPSRPEGMSVDEHESHHARSAVDVTPSAPEGAQTAGTVYQLDPESRRVRRKITVPGAVHHTLITPDGRYGIATHPVTAGISVVDLDTGVVRFLGLAPAPYHLTAVRGTGKLYVSSREQPKVWVVDQDSLELLSEFPIRGVGHQMAVLSER